MRPWPPRVLQSTLEARPAWCRVSRIRRGLQVERRQTSRCHSAPGGLRCPVRSNGLAAHQGLQSCPEVFGPGKAQGQAASVEVHARRRRAAATQPASQSLNFYPPIGIRTHQADLTPIVTNGLAGRLPRCCVQSADRQLQGGEIATANVPSGSVRRVRAATKRSPRRPGPLRESPGPLRESPTAVVPRTTVIQASGLSPGPMTARCRAA